MYLKFLLFLSVAMLATPKSGVAEQGGSFSSLAKKVASISLLQESLHIKALQKACNEALKKHCAGKNQPVCLKEKRDIVSATCKDAINEVFGRVISKAEMYHGVLIPKGSKYFYGGGKIQGVILSEDIKYKGIKFKKGQMRFHDEGPSIGHLTHNQYIDGIKYKAGNLGPFFNKDGSVSNAVLAEDATINDIVYAGDSQIEFYGKNNIKRATLKSSGSIFGVNLSAGQSISFTKDHRTKDTYLNIYFLKKDTAVNGITYAKGKGLGVWPNGRVKNGTLVNSSMFNDKEYKPSTVVVFNKDGGVVKSTFTPKIKPLVVGDIVKLPDYALAISGNNRSVPAIKYKGKDLLNLETISSRLSTHGYPTKNLKVNKVLEPQATLKIIHFSKNEQVVLEDSQGVKYIYYTLDGEIRFQPNKCNIRPCASWKKLFKDTSEGDIAKHLVQISMHILDKDGKRIDPRLKLRPPYPEGFLERSLKAWKKYSEDNSIETDLSSVHGTPTAKLNILDAGDILLHYEDLNIKSISRLNIIKSNKNR
jgi:hypothetical protein